MRKGLHTAQSVVQHSPHPQGFTVDVETLGRLGWQKRNPQNNVG